MSIKIKKFNLTPELKNKMFDGLSTIEDINTAISIREKQEKSEK